MSKSVLELAVGTGQWNAGLKKAKSALDNFTQSQGGLQQALAKDSDSMQKFVRMMGQADSTAKTAKGQMNDYKSTIEQLTMQYNRMTDAQKKSIGQEYLHAIDQMKQKYQSLNEEVRQMNQSLSNTKMPDADKGATGLFGGGKLDGMLQVFGGNLMTKAAGMAASFASELGDMVQQGMELAKQGEGIRIAFERLGRGDILDGLREATHGTVTDLELMKAAVKFNDFKLPIEELGTMLAFAQQKAKDTGQSVDYMVDSIVTGLGRKSLMILDNLGLSATEVKEKMKETGDMTKAVGEIIRDQMAKAGDYVETSADRAAQANVSLQNKMEELGRKFAPLEEASNSLWTSMKIGILDIIGGPLTDLLNKLTQAGRMANAYGMLGGSSKVGKMVSNLSNEKEGNRQTLYQIQQEKFWKYINPREQQLKDIRAWQSGERNEALQKRVGAITEKYGSLDATKIQAEVDAAKKMLADYQQAAKQILSPVKADINTKGAEQNVESLKAKLIELEAQRKKAIATGDTDLSKNLAKQISQVKSDIKGLGGTTTTTRTGKTEVEAAIGSIDYQTKKVQELQKAWRAAADDDSREKIKKQIEEQQYVLDKMTGKEKFDPNKVLPMADLAGDLSKRKADVSGGVTTDLKKTLDAKTINMGTITPLKALEDELARLKALQQEFGGASAETWQAYQAEIEKTQDSINKLTGDAKVVKASFKDAASAVGNLGSALSGLDDPGAKIAGTVAQAIANIALAFSSADLKDGERGNVWYWIAATAAGLATMVSTISSIHAATKYAEGGMVKGNSYSGDNILGVNNSTGELVGLNAGEIVLNRAQQGNLLSQGSGNGFNGQIVGRIEGENIVLVANRYFKRTGQGEILTWKN